MAKDDFDDWGDDPFAGDIDFDFDFDNAPKKGFFASMGSGFLSELHSGTIGSSEGRLRTAKMLLPKSFGTVFDLKREFDWKKQEILSEVKAGSKDMVEDLQAIAQMTLDRHGDKVPNKIAQGLETFSNKDFSHWDQGGYTPSDPSMGEVDEDGLAGFISGVTAQQTGTMVGIGRAINSMTAVVGGRQLAQQQATNSLLGGISTTLQGILRYQNKIQAKNDAVKINLLARMHLTNAKYYKFMEASMHRQIDELKKITLNSGKSDYEKTSLAMAAKGRLRDSIFSTIGRRSGGVMGYLSETFGKEAREGMLSGLSGMVGAGRMGMEMSEGMGLNMGTIIGQMLANEVIERGPAFFKSGQGAKLINKLATLYPKEAKNIRRQYRKLEQLGSVLSYAGTNAAGLAGTILRNNANYEEDFSTYDDYLDSLAPGEKPLSESVWRLKQTGKNFLGNRLNDLSFNINDSRGKQYELKKRNLMDLTQPSYWSSQSDRTLNEIIPGWFAKLHLSLEKIRTGNDNLKEERFDYRSGKFLSHKQTQNVVKRNLLNGREFSGLASGTADMVSAIDKNGTLSPEAKRFLSYRLARDVDQDKGFNPFNYFGMEDEDGLTPSIRKEIEQVMRGSFRLTDQHIEAAKKSGLAGIKAQLNMPTAKSKRLAADLSLRAKNLKGYLPNISQQIDLLRNAGYDPLLREMNLINSENGSDFFNTDAIWDRLKSELNGNEGLIEEDDVGPLPTRGGMGGGNSKTIINNRRGLSGKDSGKLVTALSELTEQLKLGIPGRQDGNALSPEQVKSLTDSVMGIRDINQEQLEVLKQILSRQPAEVNKPKTDAEDAADTAQKKTILDRIKSLGGIKDIFSAGMDKLLAHEPLMLGGMLGGLAGLAIHDPKTAALIGGGAAAWALYTKVRSMADARDVSDDEDIYDGESEDPILEARKLRARQYYDKVLKKIITSWKEIKGSIVDLGTKVVISAKRLSGKLFSAEGKAVVLRGLNAVKSAGLKLFNWLDPLNRLKGIGQGITNRITQMDVYRVGEDSPVLTRKGFENGKYFKRLNGSVVPVKGWRDIDGPVYDENGDVIITQAEYEDGLITSGGMKIESLKRMTGVMGGKLLDLGRKLGDRAKGYGKRAGDKINDLVTADYTPITNSVDRIYALLCRKFGYDVNDMPDIKADIVNETSRMGNTDDVRLNSLEDKERKAKAERESRYQDAIIDLAGHGEGERGSGSSDGEKKGGGFLNGLLGLVKNPMGTILGGVVGLGAKLSKFLTLGITTLPAIVGGLTSLAKILTVGLLGRRASDGVDDIVDAAGGASGRRRGRRTRGGRVGRGRAFKFGLAGLATAGLGMYLDATNEEHEGANWKDVASNTLTAASAVSLGSSAMSAMGINLGIGSAIASGASAAGSAIVSGTGALATAVAPLLFNPVTLGIGAVAGAGYLIYKYYAKGKGSQFKLRMAQYGIKDVESDLAAKIRSAEEALREYVVVTAGVASIAKSAPLEQIFQSFIPQANDKGQQQAYFTWFNLRFKPIFLTYASAIDTAGYRDFETFDKSTDAKLYSTVSTINDRIGTINPYPYQIAAQFDEATPIMGKDQTINQVRLYLDELKSFNERHGRTAEGIEKEGVVTMKTSAEQVEKSEKAGWWSSLKMRVGGTYEDRSDIEEINKRYPVTKSVMEINITDLLPGGDKPLAGITALRLAAYGDTEHIPWRVEAVLKLERYCEDYISVIGNDARFTSTTGAVYNLFKNSFRITDDQANQWCTWFRDRFLPVCMAWVKYVRIMRGVKPSAGWKSMTATNAFDFAKELLGLKVNIGKTPTSVWEVKWSPFTNTTSGSITPQVKAIVNNLDTAAKNAKLNFGDKEVKASGAKEVVPYTSAHSMGEGGLNQAVATAATSDNVIAGGQPVINYKPITGNTDTSTVDLSGVAPVGGSVGGDKGVSVPQKAAEQLIMKEMIKAGFTDPRLIAEMLALANFESGGFKNTAEGMNYKPGRLLEIFPGRVKSMAQAQQIVAGGPQAIANAVYGGRMGNSGPNDGWLYRGRGFIQLTGKDNFRAASQYVGKDLVKNPELVSTDPEVMAKTLIWYLSNGSNGKRLQSIVKNNSFEYAAQGLNPNGLPDMPARTRLYQQYMKRLTSNELTVDPNAGATPSSSGETPPSSVSSVSPDAKPPTMKSENVGTANSVAAVSAITTPSVNQGPKPIGAVPSTPVSEGSVAYKSDPANPLNRVKVPTEQSTSAPPTPLAKPVQQPDPVATAQVQAQGRTNDLLAQLLKEIQNQKAPDPRMGYTSK